jgi:hypothetical protein
MTTTSPTRMHERNHPVTTAPARPAQAAPALHVVTAEDAAKSRKAIEELERIERLVTTVLVILGVGGLIFTAVNVTLFAIKHHVSTFIGWMLDPLVSISLLSALFIDGKLAAHGYRPGGWPFILRWFAGLSTWLMNCWGSLYPDAKFTGWPANPDPAGLLLHSVIPFLVIILAEAGAGYRKFSTRKKAEHQQTVTAWKDQEEARRQTEAEERRQRAEADRVSAETERQRTADLIADEKRASIEAAKARDLAEAKAREIEATAEAEVRRAEQARLDAEARTRADTEAREQQARIGRANADHTAELERQRILTEAQADATRTQATAAAEVERARLAAAAKAAEDAREERRRTAEARRARTAETTAVLPEATAETTALPTAVLPERTALPVQAVTAETRKPTALLTAVPTAETDDVRGAEAKRKQIEDATFEAAVLLFMDCAPTRKEFGGRYGRSETWGRERYIDAERQMDDDADYAARVLTEAQKRAASTTNPADTNEDEQVSA